MIGDTRAVEPLTCALGDNDSNVQAAAVVALKALGPPSGVKSLVASLDALNSHDPGVRTAAVENLQAISDVRAIKPLIGALSDNNGNVRDSAMVALLLMGDARAVGPLVSLAEHSWGTESGAEDAVDAVAVVLERCSRGVSKEILRRFVEFNDGAIRQNEYETCPGFEWGHVSGEHRVNCSRIKQLARQELIRRGLKA